MYKLETGKHEAQMDYKYKTQKGKRIRTHLYCILPSSLDGHGLYWIINPLRQALSILRTCRVAPILSCTAQLPCWFHVVPQGFYFPTD